MGQVGSMQVRLSPVFSVRSRTDSDDLTGFFPLADIYALKGKSWIVL